MKTILAALAVFAALAVVGAAQAAPMRYGVADDWPKFHTCGDVWWKSMADIGYQDVRMTVQWNEGTPTVIPFQANIKAAIDCAKLNNIRPILALYPQHPAAIGSSDAQQQAFASWVALVGQAFPDVQDIIVGNEPNVNRFWQPQYAGGQDAAGKDYEHTLAYSYDKLKVARPDSIVWGPAISSRGNDNASAASNPSHSPVWFIKYMGDAYRASGRTKPIFDEFNMHPYPPIQDTDPFTKPFQWPQAGAANLDRIKQAIWDAFNGTAQPTVTEQPGGKTAAFAVPQALPINLDEAGEQTVVTGHEPAYDGTPENVQPISEQAQADAHVGLYKLAECDPAVKAVEYFPLIDDTGISTGFQSGNLFADFAHKLSYAAMKAVIASDKGVCPGASATWSHTTQVIGAAGMFGGPGTDVGSTIADKPAALKSLWLSVTANEDANYTATLLKDSGGAVGKPLTGLLKAYYKPAIKFDGLKLPAGTYKVQIVLTAATNPSRSTTLTSNTFGVGVTSGSTGKGNGKGKGKPAPACKKKLPNGKCKK